MKEMLNIAALDAKYDIIILPMASEIPDSGFKSIAAQSKKLDNKTIRNFNFSKL
jgi:cyanophycinase